ncbi:MAG: hypothetical protein IJ655_03260 [Lachnospiraceae bacterium]|nr:hypothetical protein [Lachnospiraceae bacterium]
MWYVIQTYSGSEHDVCTWINTYVDQSLFERCFVPLYEDVWRKDGIGHINVKKLFPGYVFVETDNINAVYVKLKELPKMTSVLSMDGDKGDFLTPIYSEEEEFLNTILSGGILRVSYVEINKNRKIKNIIGPLEYFRNNIIKMDVPHRRAIVELEMMGEIRTIKFGLWMDVDPKIEWIENAKKELSTAIDKQVAADGSWQMHNDLRPDNIWDWKAWRDINANRKEEVADDELYGFKVGDYVINTTGICGETPLEVVKINPRKKTIVVTMTIFGNDTNVEMNIDSVVLSK